MEDNWIRRAACEACNHAHLVEFWVGGDSSIHPANTWKCRRCGTDYSMPNLRHHPGKVWYCRMNGPIYAEFWDGSGRIKVIQKDNNGRLIITFK